MGILKEIFGDNRVLTAKNEEIQSVLTYMYCNYKAFIEELTYRGEKRYIIRCCDKKLFNHLYQNGMFGSAGNIIVPGGSVFNSKTEAYEGLVWFCNYLKSYFDNKKKDEDWF